MLEEKIDTLIQSIDCLTVALERLWKEKNIIHETEDTPKEPKPKKEESTITRDDLHDLCLKLVRDNPKNKKKIPVILNNRLIKELEDGELEEIKAKLEKI